MVASTTIAISNISSETNFSDITIIELFMIISIQTIKSNTKELFTNAQANITLDIFCFYSFQLLLKVLAFPYVNFLTVYYDAREQRSHLQPNRSTGRKKESSCKNNSAQAKQIKRQHLNIDLMSFICSHKIAN